MKMSDFSAEVLNVKLDSDGVRKAIKSGTVQAASLDASLLLVFEGMSNAEHALGSAFPDLWRSLKKSKEAESSGLTVLLRTSSTIAKLGPRKLVVVAIHPSKKLLAKIDGLYGVEFVVVLPWLKDDVESWIRAHKAAVEGTGGCLGAYSPGPPPSSAMTSLVKKFEAHVNSGISQSSDFNFALDEFKACKSTLDPKELEVALGASGFSPPARKSILDLAMKIASGKTVRRRR
jgi:hypothetical protein